MKKLTLYFYITYIIITHMPLHFFYLGPLLISACLLLVAHAATGTDSCTNLSDLAEPCGCTLTRDNFDPICGSDGNSYMNLCFMDCKKTLEDKEITVGHKGPCSMKNNCVCTSVYAPVCGSNGVTYPNDCVLKCNIQKMPSLKLQYKGVCDDDNDETRLLRSVPGKCVCNPSNSPVCASNGATYTNYCVLRCRAMKDPSIKFVNWGICEELTDSKLSDREDLKATPAPPAPKKSCGCGAMTHYTRCGNGRRYRSPCEARCDSYKPVNPRPCDSIVEKVTPRPEEEKLNKGSDATCYCSSVNRPVCGSNGQTFTNNCVLHCTTKKDPSITFQRWGPCGHEERSDEDIRLVSRNKYRDTLRQATVQRGSVRFELEYGGRKF